MTLFVILLACPNALANEMPCVRVEKELLNDMSSLPLQNDKDFLTCIRGYRVCLLSGYGEVIKAHTIRTVTVEDDARFDSVLFGVVQTPPDDDVTLCLVGAYAGGNSGAWGFKGWRITESATVELVNMRKGLIYADSMPARSLANYIFDVYKQYGTNKTAVSSLADAQAKEVPVKNGYYVRAFFGSKEGGRSQHHRLYEELKQIHQFKDAHFFCIEGPDEVSNGIEAEEYWKKHPVTLQSRSCVNSAYVMFGPFPSHDVARKMAILAERPHVYANIVECDGRCSEIGGH